MQEYPRCWATRARPTPVLPEVGSTMVPPGLSSPSASAASIIFTAIRSLELPPGLRYSTFATTVPAPAGTTEFRRTSGVPPMRSLMCCAIRMRSSSQAISGHAHPTPTAAEPRHVQVLAGGFADVLTDLAQRTDCLGHHRGGQLEVVHLAGPHPYFRRHTNRRKSLCRQLSVVQQHLGSGHMDQR